MKNKVNLKKGNLKVVTVIAVFLAVILIAAIISITANVIPILVTKKYAEEWMDEREFDLRNYDLKIVGVKYDKDLNGYGITYQDKKSEDVIFTITYSEKYKFVWSDFYDMVWDRESTVKRLEREMAEAVNPVIEDTLKKEKFIVLKNSEVSLKDGFMIDITTVKLMPPANTKFSKDLGLKGDYKVVLKSEFRLHYHEIADIITSLKKAIEQDGFLVNGITVEFDDIKNNLIIYVKNEAINEQLAENLEYCIENDAKVDNIDVFVER